RRRRAPHRGAPVHLPAAGERELGAPLDGGRADLAALPWRSDRAGQPPAVGARDQPRRARRAPPPDRGPRPRGGTLMPAARALWGRAAAWLSTYALHSTLLLGAAWAASGWLRRRSPRLEEAAWRGALVGSLVTASLQLAAGWHPLAGRWVLPVEPETG